MLVPMVATLTKKDTGQGSRIYLPVPVENALVFLGDPHAAISDGIITGTGIECSMKERGCSESSNPDWVCMDSPLEEAGFEPVWGFIIAGAVPASKRPCQSFWECPGRC